MGFSSTNELFAKFIAGDIVLSPVPGAKLKQWRLFFDASQKEVADVLDITASVISDYESSRRKKPGTEVIQKIVSTLLQLDEKYDVSLGREVGAFIFQKNKQDSSVVSKRLKDSLGLSLFAQQSNAKLVFGNDSGSVKNILAVDVVSTNPHTYLQELTKQEQCVVIFTGESIKDRLCFLLLSGGQTHISAIITSLHFPLTEIEKRVCKVLSVPIFTADYQTYNDLLSKVSLGTDPFL